MMNSTDIISALQWRYATKQFDASKKIDDQTLQTLIESLRLAPSSFGLQPRSFVIVENPAVRGQLVEHARGQKQVVDASHLIVLCRKINVDEDLVQSYIADTAQTRGVSVESLDGFKNMLSGFVQQKDASQLATRASKQIYIALGFLLETAALLQIDACPMEWFNPAKFDEILGLEKLWLASVVACPLGYRSIEDTYAQTAKVRFANDAIIHRI